MPEETGPLHDLHPQILRRGAQAGQFNSLQAQREACEAFIASQRHEGWICLRAGYDDGGFSGASPIGELCNGCSPTSPRVAHPR